MNKYVLFSPIGSNDPISVSRNGESVFDGSMLHVVRKYLPEVVILYVSEEMKDRVEDCKKLIEDISKDVEVIVEFAATKEVYKYEDMNDEIRSILNKINVKYPDFEIIVNVSSGTPQMKTALILESITSSYRIMAIQVDSPNKSSNAPLYVSQIELFEMCEDNKKEINDRTSLPDFYSFRKNMLKEQVKSLISDYDYNGASKLLKCNDYLFNEVVINLINHAKHRINNNFKKAMNIKLPDEIKSKIMLRDYRNVDEKLIECYEYFNILKIKAKRREINDYLLRMKALVDSICFIELERRKIIKDNKIIKNDSGIKYISLIKESFKEFDENRLITLKIAIKLIELEEIFTSDIIKMIDEIDDYSKKRNKVAHTLEFVDINEKDVNKINDNFANIIKEMANDKLVNDSFKLYDRINEFIEKELDR